MFFHEWTTIFLFLPLIANGSERPNIVILLADDLGYGDLQLSGGGGHPTSKTPNLNKLALNSMVMNNFYVASPLCSPSRAALLTGMYPVSTGIYPGVFWADSIGGLAPRHKTLATRLSSIGFATAHVGKWHLGVGESHEHLPTRHGFDSYLGIPYSHDMCPCVTCFPGGESCLSDCHDGDVSCPLFDGEKVAEQPVDLATLTEKYTAEATRFIKTSAEEDKPFFLYLAFHQTHHPQFAGKMFRNTTLRGGFGDALAEMDDAVGRIMSALSISGQRNNTLVIFTSDNGPSLMRQERGGCAGLLRCGKATTWEGGMRVPAMFHWDGFITPGLTDRLVTSLDIVPTVLGLVNYTEEIVQGHGVDVGPILFDGMHEDVRESFLYFSGSAKKSTGALAVRYKNFKAHFYTQGNSLSDDDNYDHSCRHSSKLTKHDPPLIFDLDLDPGERHPIPEDDERHRRLAPVMEKIKREEEVKIDWDVPQIDRGRNRSAATCCNRDPLGCEPFPKCCDCAWEPKNDEIIVV